MVLAAFLAFVRVVLSYSVQVYIEWEVVALYL